MSDRGRFVRGLKKLKNVIAYSCSESLNSHKKTIKIFFTFFRKISKSWGPIWPLLGFFFKKVILPKWSPYIALTSDQKSEKSLEPFFRKNEKILDRFDPFLPKKGSRGFFFKKRFSSLFYIYHPLTVSRKSEKSLEPIPITLCYWQTN